MRRGVELCLGVVDFAGPSRWRWVLTDPDGTKIAEHGVDLDPADWRFEAFGDMDQYLRWRAVPDRRPADEASIFDEVGRWVGECVLGPVGAALWTASRSSPVTVRVVIPWAARMVACYPLESAVVDDRRLADGGVTFVMEVVPGRGVPPDGRGKKPVDRHVRMLALFSLPEGAGALNLRKERIALVRAVRDIAMTTGRAIDLRVLQYGVSRARLRETVAEPAGWDVLHMSGHGARTGLLLEHADGGPDPVSIDDLIDLLAPLRQRVKLATISACSSAALLAAELATRLDCGVLAMRFPVADTFAAAFTGRVYDRMLGQGTGLPAAVAASLSDVGDGGYPRLSLASPAIFGSRAACLTVELPSGVLTAAGPRPWLPPPPERFVGRVGVLARAGRALAAGSGRAGVLLQGMAGIGKTACALELAAIHGEDFDGSAWITAQEGDDALVAFALAVEDAIAAGRDGGPDPPLRFANLLDEPDALRVFLPRLAEVARDTRLLIAVDGADSLLTESGRCRDERWGMLIQALSAHDGRSRLVITSRRSIASLDGRVAVEHLHGLSEDEAVMLMGELPHLRELANGHLPGLGAQACRLLARRILATTKGHPKLLELADGQAANPDSLRRLLTTGDPVWVSDGGMPTGFFGPHEAAATVAPAGAGASAADDYEQVMQAWTRQAIAGLQPEAAMLFCFLCLIEERDRRGYTVAAIWPYARENLGTPDPPANDPMELLTDLADAGLVRLDSEPISGIVVISIDINPLVAQTGRDQADATFVTRVYEGLADFWVQLLLAFADGDSGHEHSSGVLSAAPSAVTYLRRLGQWEAVLGACEAWSRDTGYAATMSLLPVAGELLSVGRGQPWEADAHHLHTRLLMRLNPTGNVGAVEDAMDAAIAAGNYQAAYAFGNDLIQEHLRAGRTHEAITLAERCAEWAEWTEWTELAQTGPWTPVAVRGQLLQVLVYQGHYERVLDEVTQLMPIMDSLPLDQPEARPPWNIYEATIDCGAMAAIGLGRWAQALGFAEMIVASMERRSATDAELTAGRFKRYGPLLRLGRITEAVDLLRECRAAFEALGDFAGVAMTLGALADAESELGHGQVAIDLAAEALRYKYVHDSHRPESVSTGHHNLGMYLAVHADDHVGAAVHHLAAALVRYLTDDGELAESIHDAAVDLALGGVLPPSLAVLCAQADALDGLNLTALVSRICPEQHIRDETFQAIVWAIEGFDLG